MSRSNPSFNITVLITAMIAAALIAAVITRHSVRANMRNDALRSGAAVYRVNSQGTISLHWNTNKAEINK